MAYLKQYHYDSRHIHAEDSFFCLPKGNLYIQAALDKGAHSVVKLNRSQLAVFSDRYFNHPSRHLCVIGVTGTNGKTTVCHFIAHVLMSIGYKPYVLGTLNSDLTTPESWDTQSLMAAHLEDGGTHFVMEVSSHGIDQGRVMAIDFDYKLLTNITQDHLDYHGTLDAYQKVKLGFMMAGPCISLYPDTYLKEGLPFSVPFPGRFNDENCRAACAVLRQLKVSESDLIKYMQTASPPPGRFELIDEGQPFQVFVDYAHTPDGLRQVLDACVEIVKPQKGRIITVFGCGGDRDRDKRSKMGRIVDQYADYIVVTQDNPRSELPSQIIADVLQGIADTSYHVIEDRAEAIRHAVFYAEPNDLVLIAGKGHETYQILKDKTIDFDDRVYARQALKERTY